MKATDADLRTRAVQRPYDPRDWVWRELRTRTRWAIIRKLPNPEGVCGHGMRVYADQRGAYSSGYVCHFGSHRVCNGGAGYDVEWATVPEHERLLALLDSLTEV